MPRTRVSSTRTTVVLPRSRAVLTKVREKRPNKLEVFTRNIMMLGKSYKQIVEVFSIVEEAGQVVFYVFFAKNSLGQSRIVRNTVNILAFKKICRTILLSCSWNDRKTGSSFVV